VSYSEIRAALYPNGFFVDNLWHLTRISYALGRSGDVRHPQIPLAIASIAERVATAWDGIPLDNSEAQRVEGEILPKLQALVELADSEDTSEVNAAIIDAQTAAAVALS
jgi:hypothetical protein